MTHRSYLLDSQEELPERLSHEDAREVSRLARASRSEETNQLLEIGMTRRLRHARIAIDGIAAEEMVRLTRLLYVVAVLSAVASVASAIAACVTAFA